MSILVHFTHLIIFILKYLSRNNHHLVRYQHPPSSVVGYFWSPARSPQNLVKFCHPSLPLPNSVWDNNFQLFIWLYKTFSTVFKSKFLYKIKNFQPNFQNTANADSTNNSSDDDSECGDDDVVIVYADEPTSAQAELSAKLRLAPTFFIKVDKIQSPGCKFLN